MWSLKQPNNIQYLVNRRQGDAVYVVSCILNILAFHALFYD